LAKVEESLEKGKPYACAFIDVRMPPGWDGVETAKRIWEVDPDLPIVLCTAYSDHSWEEVSQQLDRTDQLLILKKPFDPIELRQVVASQTARWDLNRLIKENTMQLEQRVEKRTREMFEARDLVFFTLARLAESRDPETGQHLERIEGYTGMLVNWLAENGPYQGQIDDAYRTQLCRSSILHDIGKVGIPDSILLKPSRLTADEFEIMKQHSRIGAEALEDSALKSKSCKFLSLAAEIARYHHEKFDGTGYPHGIKGLQIPLSARIVAVADVFDALTSERIYKRAMPCESARSLIVDESGKHFDPEIVNAFQACWDEFKACAEAPKESPRIPLVAQLVQKGLIASPAT
jgi:putative two-component system response regulator